MANDLDDSEQLKAFVTSQAYDLKRWQYTALPLDSSIRIIHLLPATDPDDPLEIRFFETTLTNGLEYDAVSYCWGTETNASRVLCNEFYLPITSNLDAALRRFRNESSSISLWVDSICINQDDIAECASQVCLMGDIYQQASEVHIWLGEEDEYEDTSAVIEYFQLLQNNVAPRVSVLFEWKGSSDELHKELNMPGPTSLQFTAFQDFFLKRPWFNRAWTFQESFLARKKTFYCGRLSIPNESMGNTVALLGLLSQASNDMAYQFCLIPTIKYMIYGLKDYLETKELDSLLSFRRGVGCKNPSDLIYSLLGVTFDIWKSTIIPDYQKSFPVVFAESTRDIIQHNGSLDIFSEINYTSTPTLGLPTWVPDWRQVHDNHLTFSESIVEGPLFKASGSSKAIAQLSPDSIELTLSGLFFDVISSKSPEPSVPGHFTWVKDQINNEVFPKTYKFTNETIEDVLIRTILNDTTNDSKRFTTESLSSFRAVTQTLKSEIEIPTSTLLDTALIFHPRPHFLLQPKIQEEATADGGVLLTLDAMTSGNHNAFIMQTQKGVLGTVNSVAIPGDVIIIPLGGQVPLVLRPQNDNKFTFVGECYCHGFMDGEAFVEARREVDLLHDGGDGSWLERLHEEAMPFPVRGFVLV